MRLALRRALGALGGAFGAVPLIPLARSLGERLAGPAKLAGRELASKDVKAASWAELAVLVLVVPAFAFFFGRVLPDWVRSRGGFAVALPGLVMGSAFWIWRHGLSGSRGSFTAGVAASGAVVGLSIFGPRLLGRHTVGRAADPPPRSPEEEEGEAAGIFSLPLVVVLFFAFAIACRILVRTHGAVGLFEEGQILAPLQVYLSGGAPYRDTYPVHGWGTDGGVDALAARLASPTLQVVRLRRGLWAALGVSALAFACWAFFRRPLWSLLAFGLTLALCPSPSERQLPAFAGLAALVVAASSGRRRAWVAAGGVAAAALFYALDFGVFLLIAGALTAATLGALERGWRATAKRTLAFAAGAVLGSVPFVSLLALRGALGSFVRVSFRELPAQTADIWGLPAASTVALLGSGDVEAFGAALLRGRGVPWLPHAALLALAVAVLLFRSVHPGLTRCDRAAVAASGFAIIAMRGALGRADVGHLVMYGPFVALPAAWLLFRASRAAHARWLWAPALAIALAVAVRPAWVLAVARAGLRGPEPEACEGASNGGRATIPCWQGEDLDSLRHWMDRELSPGQTFFDYGNEPALYFLLDRRPPLRYSCVPCYEDAPAQREVIAALERERPPVAILASGSWTDAFDGLSSRERTPLVAAYLDRHYAPAGQVGPRALGRRRKEP